MKYYLDITLLTNGDITLYFLWEKVYPQLHLAFVEKQNEKGQINIGVAFPEYNEERHLLGSKLRLFALTKEDLESLPLTKWFSRLSEYIQVSAIQIVPNEVNNYASFTRIQIKRNNERLARRKASREKISYDEALKHFVGRHEKNSKAPFIHMKSLSSGENYKLLIEKIVVKDFQMIEGFSTYGLSSKNSLPIF